MALTHRQRVLRGRIGGLARAAKYDGLTVTQKARDTYAASFLSGHQCAVCPRIDIPSGVSDVERARRAVALKRLHYQRCAARSAEKRSRRRK